MSQARSLNNAKTFLLSFQDSASPSWYLQAESKWNKSFFKIVIDISFLSFSAGFIWILLCRTRSLPNPLLQLNMIILNYMLWWQKAKKKRLQSWKTDSVWWIVVVARRRRKNNKSNDIQKSIGIRSFDFEWSLMETRAKCSAWKRSIWISSMSTQYFLVYLISNDGKGGLWYFVDVIAGESFIAIETRFSICIRNEMFFVGKNAGHSIFDWSCSTEFLQGFNSFWRRIRSWSTITN